MREQRRLICAANQEEQHSKSSFEHSFSHMIDIHFFEVSL